MLSFFGAPSYLFAAFLKQNTTLTLFVSDDWWCDRKQINSGCVVVGHGKILYRRGSSSRGGGGGEEDDDEFNVLDTTTTVVLLLLRQCACWPNCGSLGTNINIKKKRRKMVPAVFRLAKKMKRGLWLAEKCWSTGGAIHHGHHVTFFVGTSA